MYDKAFIAGSDKPINYGNVTLSGGAYTIIGALNHSFVSKNGETIVFPVLVLAKVKDNTILPITETVSFRQLSDPHAGIEAKSNNVYYNSGNVCAHFRGFVNGVNTTPQVIGQIIEDYYLRPINVEVKSYNGLNRDGDIVTRAKYRTTTDKDAPNLTLPKGLLDKIDKMLGGQLIVCDEAVLTKDDAAPKA